MKDKLSICMFSNLYPPIVSGSSTFSSELSRRLAARGHQVSLITAQVDDLPAREEKDGVQIYRMPSIRLPQMALAHNFKWMTYTYTPKNQRWLDEFLTQNKFDALHQQNHVFDTILSSSRLARKFQLPLILTVHTYAQHPNRLFDAVLLQLDGLSRRVVFEKANVVVSPDPVVAKYVEERHFVQNSPVIPYGIEIPTLRDADVTEIRQKYHLGEGPVLLSLGHINPLRSRIDLIQAMPKVLEQFPHCKLLIVGHLYIQEPADLVRKLGLEDSVIFTGAVPHEQTSAFFAVSDLETHTVTSHFPGPGIASMEAMAAGLPVITGEIDERYHFDTLQNWENVVFTPYNDPTRLSENICRLLADKSLRQKIGQNARQSMHDHYSWDVVCLEYEKLYRQPYQPLGKLPKTKTKQEAGKPR